MKPRIKTPQVSLRKLVPSALTVAAICLGLSAVKYALDHRPTEAMALLAGAAILDALDGRAARMLNATSKMGAEIDSLADAVNFGVAPAFIVYATLLAHNTSPLAWIVVLLYAVCIVLRLARFNAMLDVEGPAFEKEFFTGMPAPAGAIGAIGPLAAKMQFPSPWWDSHWGQIFICGWLIAVFQLRVASSLYWSSIIEGLYFDDAIMGLVKPFCLGYAIVTIGCHVGLRTKGGTQGVGRATTQAVVAASVAVIAVDFFVTRLLIGVLY